MRDGVSLKIPGENGPRLIFAQLGVMVQDERAHKASTQVKGSGGRKFCPFCQNVVPFHSPLIPDPSGFCVPSTCCDYSKFLLHTDSTVKAITRRLADVARHGPSPQLNDLQINLGFVHAPHGILADPCLDINLISIWQWDWMHVYFVDGIFNTELRELMHVLNAHSLGGAAFHEYLQAWQWPKGSNSQIWFQSVCNREVQLWHRGVGREQCTSTFGYPAGARILTCTVHGLHISRQSSTPWCIPNQM